MARYLVAVASHTCGFDQHFDLFIGAGATLPTVQLRSVRGRWYARRIQSHRRRYLTWSGSLSGRRGQVRQVLNITAVGIIGRQRMLLRFPPNFLSQLGIGAKNQLSLYQQRELVVRLAVA